jgi:hypothetical protein
MVFSLLMRNLALTIALVSRWHERQWQVPKACARIFLGCRAVGIVRRVFVRQPSPVPILFLFFQVPRCLWKRLVVPVEKLDRWDVERYFVGVENLSGYTDGHCCQRAGLAEVGEIEFRQPG